MCETVRSGRQDELGQLYLPILQRFPVASGDTRSNGNLPDDSEPVSRVFCVLGAVAPPLPTLWTPERNQPSAKRRSCQFVLVPDFGEEGLCSDSDCCNQRCSMQRLMP